MMLAYMLETFSFHLGTKDNGVREGERKMEGF
jgi:hypothetical protein